MSTRCLVLHTELTGRTTERAARSGLEEAVGLALALELDVVSAQIVRLRRVVPATLIGKGKCEELKEIISNGEIALVIVNRALSPVQQRNLERAWNCKVIDRTALILEIFGERARTAEGKLQVELAALDYQKSRLVRSWTHLERQRGGFGFLGGPGESQIEIDRRLIGERMDKIRKQLAGVTRTRELHRARRRDAPYPVVALVGYTNAGKSTLFNRLTDSTTVARDQLFATLDPTVRAIALPSGLKILMSDTVGFISDLPTELIAAFRATLEEVLEADLLVHVRDSTHPDSEDQKRDVIAVLQNLFGAKTLPTPMLEVLNKADLGEAICAMPAEAIRLSALTGEGCDALTHAIERALSESLLETHRFYVRHDAGKALAWLHAHGKVTPEKQDDEGMTVRATLTSADAARYVRMFG